MSDSIDANRPQSSNRVTRAMVVELSDGLQSTHRLTPDDAIRVGEALLAAAAEALATPTCPAWCQTDHDAERREWARMQEQTER